ncbi:MAG: NAD(P)/FAD-dependent oxidoreductase [Nitrospirae bacterium]|nr:NAD(P)/FAD-dependent oxidoreductase [Nitrospirota bacterium]
MAVSKTILILGGGIGGIVSASRLRKKLPSEYRIILVERNPMYIFTPSFLWLMTGLRTAEQISRPLTELGKKGVEIVTGDIQQIDPENRTIQVNGREIKGDYLIIALGAELIPHKIPGLVEGGYTFYTLEGAEALRDARLEIRKGRIVILVSSIPFKCPAAPYEAAMLIEYDCRKRKIRQDIQIDLYTPEPGPMGVAGPEVSRQVRQMVEEKDIHFHPEQTVTGVDTTARQIRFTNGITTDYDLLIYIPPHQAPKVVQEAGLTNASGWIPVDRGTLETRFPGVYTVGDVTGIMLPMGKPLPKAGVFAHGEAEVVANNIIHAITGKGKPAVFEGHGECFIETGDGKAGFGRGNFFAEPVPQVKIRGPNRTLHLGKVAFEKFWLFEWF